MNQKLQDFLLGSFERFTHFISVIQSDHNYIHQGIGFTHSTTFDLTGTGGATPKKECYFTTPASGNYIHWRPLVFSSSAAAIKVSFYEAGTYSGGSPLTIYNRNRNSSGTASMTIHDGSPTITADGDRVFIDIIGGGGIPVRVSGGAGGGDANEWILKLNTKYLLRVEAITTTATSVACTMFWYEETQG